MTGRCKMLIVVLVVLVGSAAIVQGAVTPLSDVIAGLEAGKTVRVHLSDGRYLEGTFAGMTTERIVIQGVNGPEFIPLSDVTALWERGRATGRVGKIGAWSVGLAAAVYGGLVEMIIEYDNSFPAAGIMLGGTLGAASGGAVGALVGSAFPRWHLRWGIGIGSRDLPVVQRFGEPAFPAARRPLGRASFGIGLLDPINQKPGRGLMVAGALTSSLGPRLRHGLDLSLVEEVEAQPSRYMANDPGQYATRGASIWSAGWRLEWSFAQPHSSSWDPYLVVGAGAYGWVETYLGANYGLGLSWREKSGSTGAFLEIRRHDNIQRLMETDPGFVTGVVGVSSSW